jgi:hypothetical protein
MLKQICEAENGSAPIQQTTEFSKVSKKRFWMFIRKHALNGAGGGTPALFYRQKYAQVMLGKNSKLSRATSYASQDDLQTLGCVNKGLL